MTMLLTKRISRLTNRPRFKPKYRMGDWNKDNTKRFWAYIQGKESWVTTERFEEAKEESRWWK